MHQSRLQQEPAQVYYRCRRRVRTGGNSAGAFIVGFGALVCLFFLWPLALILFALAFIIDAKHKWQSYCEACGNDVSETSLQCPCCHTKLVPSPSPLLPRSLKLLLLLLFLSAGAFLIWANLRTYP